MRLGFVAHYSDETMDLASRNGFDCIEVFVGKGTPLDVSVMTGDDYNRILEKQQVTGVAFASLANAVNHLAADAAQRKDNNRQFIQVIKSCKKLGSGIVMTNAWADPALSPSANIKGYQEAFSEYARAAEDEGVRIVVENCPHWHTYPLTVGNISYGPEMWAAMFDAVPSASIGLEYDPSHMYWQRIDYIKALRDFSSRIYACHAKDTEIDYDALGKTGVFGQQMNRRNEWESGWWRYRIPGWGEIDWRAIFIALADFGFNGPLFIEHEDPVFEGARFEEGLALGMQFLKQFMAPKQARTGI